MKVFYKGSFYESVLDSLTIDDVNTLYGGFADNDCYLPGCGTYCLLDVDGGTIVPEVGCWDDSCDEVSGYANLGDTDVDLSDMESLVDLLHMCGLLVGPVNYYLLDQPMDCDVVVDCKVSGKQHRMFVKLEDSVSASRTALCKRVTDSQSVYAQRYKKEFLLDSLKNKARLFKYNFLSKFYISDDEKHVTATTNEGSSMLTKFDADKADEAAEYLAQNEGQKIVKSDEDGILIGNESIDESSVKDVQEVQDSLFSLKDSRGVLDSFSKIFDCRWSFVGDVRRGVPDFSRVQVVVDSSSADIMSRLKSIKGVKKIKDCGDCVSCECSGLPFDVYACEGNEFIPAVILMTGSDAFNIMFLANALDNDCYFTEDGVFDENGESYSFIDEQDCFNTVGVDYVEPEHRNFY